MRNEKKLAYQQKQIRRLEEQINSLKQENKILEQENISLQRINNTYEQTIKDLQIEHDQTIKKYSDGLEEINEIKSQYKLAIKSANLLKKEYVDKMQVLLQQVHKQKK